MQAEHVRALGYPEKNPDRKAEGYGFFFAAMQGRYPSLRGIQGVLERKFEGGATAYNSAFLAERPRADRYQQMASDIKEKLQKGTVTIFAHSYGAVEAIRALTEDSRLLENQQNVENLRLILISPVVPNGWAGIARDLSAFGKTLVQEGRGLGFVFPGSSSIVNGIVSANTLTSDVMSLNEWDQAASLASPKLSHPVTHGLDNYPQRDYLSRLDPQIQDRIKATDKRIKKAKEDGKRRRLRKEFRKRGKVKELALPIFEGKYSDHYGDPPTTAVAAGTRSEAFTVRRRLIMDAARKQERAKLQGVQSSGVEIWRVDPEQDLMYAGRKVKRQIPVSADHVVTVPFSTHASPWGTQPDLLSSIIDAIDSLQ